MKLSSCDVLVVSPFRIVEYHFVREINRVVLVPLFDFNLPWRQDLLDF